MIAKDLRERFPKDDAERELMATPLMETFVGDYRQRLFVLLGAVAFVLLIACGNVSNLLLAPGAALIPARRAAGLDPTRALQAS